MRCCDLLWPLLAHPTPFHSHLLGSVFASFEVPECLELHKLSISNRKVAAIAINKSAQWLAFGVPEFGQLLVWEWQSVRIAYSEMTCADLS